MAMDMGIAARVFRVQLSARFLRRKLFQGIKGLCKSGCYGQRNGAESALRKHTASFQRYPEGLRRLLYPARPVYPYHGFRRYIYNRLYQPQKRRSNGKRTAPFTVSHSLFLFGILYA